MHKYIYIYIYTFPLSFSPVAVVKFVAYNYAKYFFSN